MHDILPHDAVTSSKPCAASLLRWQRPLPGLASFNSASIASMITLP
jgi:hypothetical protein